MSLIAKSATRFAAVFALVVGLVGCTRAADCLLFNNSSHQIVVLRKDQERLERLQIEPGKGSWLKSWTSSDIFVEANDKTFRFVARFPPETFVAEKGFGPWMKRQVYAQFDGDSRIYLLPVGAAAPTKSVPEQPFGFPLEGTPIQSKIQ